MPVEATFIAAVIVGLLGGVHCIGMCGGIVGALSFGLPESVRAEPRRVFPFVAAYNAGRVLSYTAAGAIMGAAGRALAQAPLAAAHTPQLVLQLLAGLFMCALGLYLAGWWSGLRLLEQGGAVLWRRVEPLGRRLFPVRRVRHALLLGLLWGWLPCGLVYSALTWSLAAGSAGRGALLMLGFGLGTLPLLMLMGLSAARLAAFVRQPLVRRIAGAAVALYGVYTVFLAVRAMLAG